MSSNGEPDEMLSLCDIFLCWIMMFFVETRYFASFFFLLRSNTLRLFVFVETQYFASIISDARYRVSTLFFSYARYRVVCINRREVSRLYIEESRLYFKLTIFSHNSGFAWRTTSPITMMAGLRRSSFLAKFSSAAAVEIPMR